RLHARAHDVAEVAEGLVEAHAVVTARGLGHSGEVAVVPGKLARLHDDSAHGGAVAADVFRRRVHHDIGAPLERAAQIGRGDRVVYHERDARLAGDFRDRLDVD